VGSGAAYNKHSLINDTVKHRTKTPTSPIKLFCVHKLRKLGNDLSSQGPTESPSTIHPSRSLSTPRRRPSPVLRKTISRTISSPPCPSPSGPNTRSSLSCSRSAIGENTLQNRSGAVRGGGGVEYERARCLRSTGGWEMTCVSVDENEG
jgi:hypothetical protein